MENEIQIKNSMDLEQNNTAKVLQQKGEKNVYADKVGYMNITVQADNIAPQVLTQASPPSAITVDRSYYNLFVTFNADFSKNTPFQMHSDRILTEYMDDNLKKEFSTLSDEVINKVKTFPCIFANENHMYGYTDEEQTLGYGFIKNIQFRQRGIKVYPQVLYLLPQQRLNEELFGLDICGNSKFNEFNHTHWCIKKVDLISELREMGFQI